MRTFSELDKEVARRLLSNHGEKHVFEVLSDCFSTRSLAVFLQGKDSSYILYAKDCDNSTLSESIQRLMSVLSILDYMEQEGMIYVIDSLSSDTLFLHELKEHYVAVVKENHRYSFEKGTVECQSGKCVVKDDSCSDIMEGDVCSDLLTQKLWHFFVGDVYDTQALVSFVGNGFKLPEVLQYEEELKHTKKSLCLTRITLLTSLLIPILCIPLSNRFGKSTLTEQQYYPVIKCLEKVDTTVSEIYKQLKEIKSKQILLNQKTDETKPIEKGKYKSS